MATEQDLAEATATDDVPVGVAGRSRSRAVSQVVIRSAVVDLLSRKGFNGRLPIQAPARLQIAIEFWPNVPNPGRGLSCQLRISAHFVTVDRGMERGS